MNVCVIGTGYVGLPTGVGFAELGNKVVCVDKIEEKIAALQAGKITLFEEGLEELFHKNALSGAIKFTTEINEAVSNADIIIIAVGTPPHPITKEADMQYIHAVAAEVAECLSGYTVIAIKSTVPVGAGDDVEKIIRETNPNANFDLIAMPEFLREGFAVYDFFNPDRVVIGANNGRAKTIIEALYDSYKQKPNILYTSRRSAELIKYASNAFLAVKIHYINEIANLCEKVGANVYEVAKGMGLDSRIGSKFLNPGPGYGGSCFPKDTSALAYIAKKTEVDLSIVEAAIKGNDERKIEMANRIINALKGIENPIIAVLGLAFKGGTDDVRESPAIEIVSELLKKEFKIKAYDPEASIGAKALLGDRIEYASSAYDAAKDADALVVLTEWEEFKSISLKELEMRTKIIVDLRKTFDKQIAKADGFIYIGIGK
ncbi:MAG: UDP-glucose/GDP-mannose dehydrogenase family protein [Helicobacteraceae bacterium]|jgi:UDPglucose 6-dehydrogenase|nr:UDP-glucose/GDP-mannose dehydrogenase family protein [Helicobacteraceae bacterium]